jgi:hypothetical protein
MEDRRRRIEGKESRIAPFTVRGSSILDLLSSILDLRRLFFVDSLVPRKNRVEVFGQGACVAVMGFYRAITPVCGSKAHADKKSYSENEMCEKWRKYECAIIDNAEYPSLS